MRNNSNTTTINYYRAENNSTLDIIISKKSEIKIIY